MAGNDDDLDPCVICIHEKAVTLPSGGFDGIHQECPRCSEFKVSGTALSMLSQGLGDEKRAKISGWVRSQNNAGGVPMLTSDVLKNVIARPLPTIMERATQLLVEASRGQTGLGERFDPSEPRFLAATYSANRSDVDFLMRILSDQGLAEHKVISGGKTAEILPSGYVQLSELNRQTPDSAVGFVAMWFADELSPAYADGFQKGIIEAGYDPVRIDQVEHVNRIDDEIIAQIKQSRFVIADFTGHRGGVYFEAGFALGLNLPVIWTCRKDHMHDLHFDIRQFNCIDWETPEELADRVQKRILAVLGPGPTKALD